MGDHGIYWSGTLTEILHTSQLSTDLSIHPSSKEKNEKSEFIENLFFKLILSWNVDRGGKSITSSIRWGYICQFTKLDGQREARRIFREFRVRYFQFKCHIAPAGLYLKHNPSLRLQAMFRIAPYHTTLTISLVYSMNTLNSLHFFCQYFLFNDRAKNIQFVIYLFFDKK